MKPVMRRNQPGELSADTMHVTQLTCVTETSLSTGSTESSAERPRKDSLHLCLIDRVNTSMESHRPNVGGTGRNEGGYKFRDTIKIPNPT